VVENLEVEWAERVIFVEDPALDRIAVAYVNGALDVHDARF
jgi:hypothetical protein